VVVVAGDSSGLGGCAAVLIVAYRKSYNSHSISERGGRFYPHKLIHLPAFFYKEKPCLTNFLNQRKTV
jgi:hypothetical protein